jgi:uncharacterized membrane protein YozB (DUF420 family)
MTTEQMILKAIQIAFALNTIIMIFGIVEVKKGNVALHRKLMSWVTLSTLGAALGLVVTVILGFDYSDLTTPTRLLIHRSFSTALFVLLILMTYSGFSNKIVVHKKILPPLMVSWVGTLVTGLWFFW